MRPEHALDEISTLRVLLDAAKVAVADLQAARDMAHAAILDGNPRAAYGGDYGDKVDRLMTLSRLIDEQPLQPAAGLKSTQGGAEH